MQRTANKAEKAVQLTTGDAVRALNTVLVTEARQVSHEIMPDVICPIMPDAELRLCHTTVYSIESIP